ncbi:DUF1389 domain-containing protein [Chlamydia vaughanii]|uniref:DUF1389 domain-containing protein n=1 Tax=Chlamydia vaughanii TaxID=3112552 RepID=UPI0032B2AC89
MSHNPVSSSPENAGAHPLQETSPSKKMAIIRKHALAIAAAVFSVISVALITVAAFGITSPGIVAAMVFSLVFALATIAFAIRRYREPDAARKPLPQSLLDVIKKDCSPVLYQFCSSQKVTFQELQDVAKALSENNFEGLTPRCKRKVKKFGINKLQMGLSEVDLKELPKILENMILGRCAFYFMKKFVELGSPDCIEPNMAPELYWFAPLALAGPSPSIFYVGHLLFAKVVTREEFDQLKANIQNKQWAQGDSLFEDIERRMLEELDRKDVSREPIRGMAEIRNDIQGTSRKVLHLLLHGINWEQLQLLKLLNISDISQVSRYEVDKLYFGALFLSAAPFLDENSKAFNRNILFTTFQDCLMHFLGDRDEIVFIMGDATKRKYHIDYSTGERTIEPANASTLDNTRQ